MKDLLEPFLYPHNILLYGLLLACICYRKKGLWLLLVFYYLMGNTFIANQVRHWYISNTTQQRLIQPLQSDPVLYVVLGCGGSAQQLPACATARLQQLSKELAQRSNADLPATVLITTRYCQPYVDYLQQRVTQLAVDCYDAGDNTYQEFSSLAMRLDKTQSLRFITSDFHSWRVSKLVAEYQFNATIGAASTQTFRAVNCGLNCMFTVNLTNLDFYSKLMAEFSSYAVYRLGGERLTGAASD
ncbi:hypothetical protein GCM10010919_15830 [Alishewanella longhuensis]|uniref:DUF218 domain-containing protein n=1 Tax=Alishewanella longhuensis TaxID=1091037 RepID=A0ABQ3KYF7_9ALTE|nr:hypothetical protein [Alishewanella longhuensis]GHG67263.1 hypothetical protein GCM10010919_15830 [Alishewanella longhuensis]